MNRVRLRDLSENLLRRFNSADRSLTIESVVAPLIALLLSFVVVGLMMVVIGKSPLKGLQAILSGSLGSLYAVGLTLVASAPLALCALALSCSVRTGLWNIGGEGQLQIGALLAFVVAHYTGSIPLAALAALVGGAVWAGIAGVLKVWRGVNEIISTIMLNFLAILTVNILLAGPLLDPAASNAATVRLVRDVWYPIILPGTSVHLGVLAAAVMCVLVYLFFRHTLIGFQMRAVGENWDAARHAGINADLCRLLAMPMAGALAGLAGAGELLGVQHRLSYAWSQGWGFSGISVALLAGNHPLGIIVMSMFLGMLDVGATNMQASTGVPSALARVLLSMPVVFLIIVNSLFQISAKRRARNVRAEQAEDAMTGVPAMGEEIEHGVIAAGR